MSAPAFDRRRVNGPEVSNPPVYIEDLEEEQRQAVAGPGPSSLLEKAKAYKRVDGTSDDLRPVFLKTGLITAATGSAYIEMDGLKLVCSVYGPRPAPPPYSSTGQLSIEVKYAPFASDPRRFPLRDTEPLSLSSYIHQAISPSLLLHLPKYTKSIIEAHILVLESDSVQSVMSAGTMVASAGLADAGIEMKGICVGVWGASLSNKLCLCPSPEEIKLSSSNTVVSCLPALGIVTNLHYRITRPKEVGDVEDIDSSLDVLVKKAAEWHEVIALALKEGEEAREGSLVQ